MTREGSRDTQEGIVISTEPDICLTPVGSAMVPVAYNIWARQADDARTTPTVLLSGLRSHNLGSLITTCHGDEAGTGGGIKSGTHNGICEPRGHSATVRSEGRNMIRHGDEWWMNNRNTVGKLMYVKNVDDYGRFHERAGMVQEAQVRLPVPEPPPMRPPPPAAANDNPVPAPSLPRAPAAGPVLPGALPPATPGFFRQYQPFQLDNGGYGWKTDLPGPLAHVETLGSIWIVEAAGREQYRLAEPLPDGRQYVGAAEIEKIYAQTRRKQARERLEDAAMDDGKSVVRVTGERARLRCWSLDKLLAKGHPKGGPANSNYPGDSELIREFCAQLKEQERAINSVSPDLYQKGRAAYKETGRGDGRDQRDLRKATRLQWVKNMTEADVSNSTAEALTDDLLGTLAALHTPDQVVSGPFSSVTRMGLGSVNSAIGGGWPSRVGDLDKHAELAKAAGNRTLNVSLCATVAGVEVCN